MNVDDSSPGERRSVRPAPHKPSQASPSRTRAAGPYTLVALVAHYGRATPSQVVAYTGAAEIAKLVSEGARISTARIVRDGARIVGQAGTLLAGASPTQREELVTLDEDFLRVTVTALADVDEAQRQLDAAKTEAATVRHTSQQRGEAAMHKARKRRETLDQALLNITGGDADWKKQITEATGSAETPDEVADSILRQVKVGRELVAWAKKRGVACMLTESYFEKTLVIGEEARALGVEGESPTVREGVRQGEVNRLGGVCLWLIRRVVSTFDAAHDADPTIPQLPVLSLRSVFHRGKSGRRETPTTPAPPVAPNG